MYDQEQDELLSHKPRKLSVKQAKKKGVLRLSSEPHEQGETDSLALVASVHGGSVSLLIEQEMREAIAPAAILTQLVVGDEVSFEALAESIRVLRILPRRTLLTRMRGEGGSRHRKHAQIIAANIDTAVIVATAAQPDFEVALVDRYLILCRANHIDPIICLNKAELTDTRHPVLAWYRAHGVPVIETSVKTGLGMEKLRDALQGKRAILLGKSGAGKSSLTQAIVPGAVIKTQAINQRAQQGKHTTSRSEVYAWSPNSLLIDTPGIRTLDVSHLELEDITLGFPEITELTRACKFTDCRHEKEPGCAVRGALEDGRIPAWRWESYLRIIS